MSGGKAISPPPKDLTEMTDGSVEGSYTRTRYWTSRVSFSYYVRYSTRFTRLSPNVHRTDGHTDGRRFFLNASRK